MSVNDVLSIVVPLATTMVGTVWYLSHKISSMDLRVKLFLRSIEALEKEIDAAREGRSKLWEKHNALSERVTIVETRNS